MSHRVNCGEFSESIRSVIYDPNGNAMTHGELCELINTLQDDVQTLKDAMQNIANSRNQFSGSSLDYMQGYRDGQEFLQRLAKLALSAI